MKYDSDEKTNREYILSLNVPYQEFQQLIDIFQSNGTEIEERCFMLD